MALPKTIFYEIYSSMTDYPSLIDIVTTCQKFGIWLISSNPYYISHHKKIALQYQIFEEISKNKPHSKFFVFVGAPLHGTGQYKYHLKDDVEIMTKMLQLIAPRSILVVGDFYSQTEMVTYFLDQANTVYGQLIKWERKQVHVVSMEICARIITKHLKQLEDKIYLEIFDSPGFFPKLVELVGIDIMTSALRDVTIPILGGLSQEFVSAHPTDKMTDNLLHDSDAANFFIEFCLKHNMLSFYCPINVCACYCDHEKYVTDQKLNMPMFLKNISLLYKKYAADDLHCNDSLFAYASYLMYMMNVPIIGVEKAYLSLASDSYIITQDHEISETDVILDLDYHVPRTDIKVITHADSEWITFVGHLFSQFRSNNQVI